MTGIHVGLISIRPEYCAARKQAMIEMCDRRCAASSMQKYLTEICTVAPLRVSRRDRSRSSSPIWTVADVRESGARLAVAV